MENNNRIFTISDREDLYFINKLFNTKVSRISFQGMFTIKSSGVLACKNYAIEFKSKDSEASFSLKDVEEIWFTDGKEDSLMVSLIFRNNSAVVFSIDDGKDFVNSYENK